MELYHVLNRGVDKRSIFLDNKDCWRFVHDLWEFNDTEDAKNVWYRASSSKDEAVRISELRTHYMEKERIVDVHGWVLMKNHYHLLVSEVVEGGITKFLRRLNIGYAMYFNERYKRKGTLFQGRTKKILIDTDAHFLYILHYIHLNPLDFLRGAKQWRSGAVQDVAQALKHLDTYRWSSYKDYCGKKNFPSILTTELFGDVFSNYQKTIRSFLKDMDTEIASAYPLEK